MKKKHRARVIEFFIDVARECFNIGNFNSLMAIICELVFCFISFLRDEKNDLSPQLIFLGLNVVALNLLLVMMIRASGCQVFVAFLGESCKRRCNPHGRHRGPVRFQLA